MTVSVVNGPQSFAITPSTTEDVSIYFSLLYICTLTSILCSYAYVLDRWSRLLLLSKYDCGLTPTYLTERAADRT
jgi:hypothetical protein